MMKKLVSIGLIGLLSCTMLTACSNSQNNSSSSSTEKTTTVKKSSKLTATNMNTKNKRQLQLHMLVKNIQIFGRRLLSKLKIIL